MSRRTRLHARQKKSLANRVLVVLGIMVFSVAAVGLTVGTTVVSSWLEDLPDYTDISSFSLTQKTKVYASDQTTLLAEFCVEDREAVELDEISDYLIDATIATEDERFYEHGAVDIEGIARAVVVNLTGGQEGASTITQQLVRNTLLIDEMNDITYKRKVREIYLAIEVEEIYTKDEILNMYMNTINYGDGAYGVEAAAWHYFSKSADELTLSEAALIAGIPNSPTYYNPKNYPENALERRNLVLDRMLSNGYITQEEHDAAQAEDLNLNPGAEDENDDGIYLYPYYTSWIRSLLLEEYSTDELYSGGLTVYTTLDVDKQEAAEEACYNKLDEMDSDIDMSLTSIDPDTGYVVALFGGKDYNEDQFNLATQASRQAGSCFKMFTLVAAIEAGIDPTTTYIDCSSPVTIDEWTVENYGGDSEGTLTIQEATQKSSNTGFARLVDVVGPENVVDVAERMGITSDLEAVLSITLGTQGVNTLQMASAYATLASGGVYHEPVFITQVLDSDGDVIYDVTTDEDTEGEQVIDEEVAKAAVEVLESVVTSGTATNAILDSGQVSAGKTGTSQDYRDSMYCGITPQLSTSIWIGAREERYIEDNVGGSNCCPVWKEYMTAALEGSELEDFVMMDADDPEYSDEAAALIEELGYGYSSSSSDDSTEETETYDDSTEETETYDSGTDYGTESDGSTSTESTGGTESGTDSSGSSGGSSSGGSSSGSSGGSSSGGSSSDSSGDSTDSGSGDGSTSEGTDDSGG